MVKGFKIKNKYLFRPRRDLNKSAQRQVICAKNDGFCAINLAVCAKSSNFAAAFAFSDRITE